MPTDDEDWNLVRADIILQKYANCNTDIRSSELFSTNELIQENLSGATVSDDEESHSTFL